jgi:hypothetical protein
MVQAVLGSRGRRRRGSLAERREDGPELRRDDGAAEGSRERQPIGRSRRPGANRTGIRARGLVARRLRHGRTAVLGLDREGPSVERRLHGSVAIRSEEACAPGFDSGQRLRRRVAVRVDRSDGHDRRPGPNGVEERLGGRGPTAVMSDLEQIDPGQAARQQDGIDLLLDVAGQQEALRAERAEEHDRDVVDRGAPVRRVAGNGIAVRPHDSQAD